MNINTKNLVIFFLVIISAICLVGALQQKSHMDGAAKAVCEYDARVQTVDSQNACGLVLDKAGKSAVCDSSQKCRLEDK